jgi:hypothetical protein
MVDVPTFLTDRMNQINQMPADEPRYQAMRAFSVSPEMIELAKADADTYVGLVEQLILALPTNGHREASLIEIAGIVGNAPGMTDLLYGQIIEKLGWFGKYPEEDRWPEEVTAAVMAQGGAPYKWARVFGAVVADDDLDLLIDIDDDMPNPGNGIKFEPPF